MGTADTSFLRNNNCKVPAVLYSCRINMVVHQVRRMCQRPKRVNDIFALTKAWLFLKQMRGSISPKSHTLQLFLLKKLPKVYRIKSSNNYRAKQGYTVIEIWQSKLVIEILSERMPSKFLNKLTEWVIIIRVRDYLVGWATWEAIVWTMEWVNEWFIG